MKNIFKKLLCIALTATFVLSGCGAADKPSQDEVQNPSVETVKADGQKSFIYPIEHDVPDFCAYTAGEDSRTVAVKPLFDYLYINTKDGFRYYLVDDVKVSDDGLNVTLHINDKANWHDGTPVSVDDLIFTIKYLEYKNETRTSKIDGVAIEYKKANEKTVEITLPSACGDFVTRLGKVMLMPSHLFDGDVSKVEGSDEIMKGLGYGPYKLKEWNKGENIVYEINKEYYRGEPKIEQLIMKIIPEDSAKEVALRNGEISFMRISSKEKYEKYKNEGLFNLSTFTESRMNYIQINPASSNITSKKMREAIFSAINLEEIMQAVYGSEDMSLPAQGIYCTEDIYYDKDYKNYDYDLEKATKLAKETGLDKMTLKYIYNNNRVNMPEVAVVVQQQLKKAGINVQLQAMDSPSFFAKFFEKINPQKDWDLGTNGWDSQMGDSGYVHGYLDAGDGHSRFCISPETNKLFAEARTTGNLEERKAKYQEAQKMLKEEYTAYPFSYPNYVLVSQKNIKGLDTVPSMLLFEDYLLLDVE